MQLCERPMESGYVKGSAQGRCLHFIYQCFSDVISLQLGQSCSPKKFGGNIYVSCL